MKDSRYLRRVDLDLAQIPADLRARWFYGSIPLEIVVTFLPDGRPAELFRRAGVASFRGVGGVPVRELAADAGGPAELVKHFGARWFDASR